MQFISLGLKNGYYVILFWNMSCPKNHYIKRSILVQYFNIKSATVNKSFLCLFWSGSLFWRVWSGLFWSGLTDISNYFFFCIWEKKTWKPKSNSLVWRLILVSKYFLSVLKRKNHFLNILLKCNTQISDTLLLLILLLKYLLNNRKIKE